MRSIVIVFGLILLLSSQVFGQAVTAAGVAQQVTQQVSQPIPMPVSTVTSAQPTNQKAVQQPVTQPSIQGHTTYRPITTQSPTAADAAVYQTSQPVYYQSQPTYQPARRAVYYQQPRQPRVMYNSNSYGNVPITMRPNRPGHPYGNFVRFINRLGR